MPQVKKGCDLRLLRRRYTMPTRPSRLRVMIALAVVVVAVLAVGAPGRWSKGAVLWNPAFDSPHMIPFDNPPSWTNWSGGNGTPINSTSGTISPNSSLNDGRSLVIHPAYLDCNVWDGGCGGDGGGPPAQLITFYSGMGVMSLCFLRSGGTNCTTQAVGNVSSGGSFYGSTGTTYRIGLYNYDPTLYTYEQWSTSAGTLGNYLASVTTVKVTASGFLWADANYTPSGNWGGQVASTPAIVVTGVSGEFVVPAPTWTACLYPYNGCNPEQTSIWMGIGGSGVSGLWQAGVMITATPNLVGGPTYGAYAWYGYCTSTNCPTVSLTNSIAVSIGDTVWIQVTSDGGSSGYYIRELTNTEFVRGTVSYSAWTGSGEWVVEAPCVSSGYPCSLYSIIPSATAVTFSNPELTALCNYGASPCGTGANFLGPFTQDILQLTGGTGHGGTVTQYETPTPFDSASSYFRVNYSQS
jgi:hypothetical protein